VYGVDDLCEATKYTEYIDCLLYGNAYTSPEGLRFDPLRMSVDVEKAPDGAIKIVHYRYRLASGKELLFDPDQVRHRSNEYYFG
jgi:hypothetical protein